MTQINKFGLMVTSNESLSHILFDDNIKTPCGLIFKIRDTKHPASDIRWYMPTTDFIKWVDANRFVIDPGYRFCKRCLSSFDRWCNQNRKQ